MSGFTPHIHTCEVKLCHPSSWEEHCPRMGNLSDTEDECENCHHFVIVEFLPDNPVYINRVVHVNS